MDWPAAATLAATAITGVLGYLGWRRSQQQDKVAAEAGIATSQDKSIQQIITGMDKLITQLQTRVEALETEVEGLKEQLRLANMAE